MVVGERIITWPVQNLGITLFRIGMVFSKEKSDMKWINNWQIVVVMCEDWLGINYQRIWVPCEITIFSMGSITKLSTCWWKVVKRKTRPFVAFVFTIDQLSGRTNLTHWKQRSINQSKNIVSKMVSIYLLKIDSQRNGIQSRLSERFSSAQCCSDATADTPRPTW